MAVQVSSQEGRNLKGGVPRLGRPVRHFFFFFFFFFFKPEGYFFLTHRSTQDFPCTLGHKLEKLQEQFGHGFHSVYQQIEGTYDLMDNSAQLAGTVGNIFVEGR